MITFIFFIVLLGTAKALSDLSQENVIWAKGASWKNKWKLDKDGELIEEFDTHWYYLWLYYPEHKERFPYSSTFLVTLTDSWHRIESLRFIACVGAIVNYDTIISLPLDIVMMWVIRTVAFSITYETTKRDLG
tara:strand:- start:681 stop:1079 length:399 start_codon:yes stop_codon:yes gene_type:complete